MPLLNPAQKADVNRQNAAKSTGPKTVAGKQSSRGNAHKHGYAGAGVVVGRHDFEAIKFQSGIWAERTQALDHFDVDIIKTGVTAHVLAQSCVEQIIRLRVFHADHAEALWDGDREVQAWDIGQKLKRNPAKYIKKLRASKHGCQWLAEAWRDLLLAASVPGYWKPAHKQRALTLLGRPLEDRELRTEFNPPSKSPDEAAARASLVERIESELKSVLELWETHVVPDQDARALAKAGAFVQTPPEILRLERYLARLTRTYEWAMNTLLNPTETMKASRERALRIPEPGSDEAFMREVMANARAMAQAETEAEEAEDPPNNAEPPPPKPAAPPAATPPVTRVATAPAPATTATTASVHAVVRPPSSPTDDAVAALRGAPRNRHERRAQEALRRKLAKE